MRGIFKRVLCGILSRLGLSDVLKETKVIRYEAVEDESLKGRNILITGGSSGIGLAIALKCLRCGGNVLITGRDGEKLESIKIEDATGRLKVMVWDVERDDEIDAKIEEALSHFLGRLDVLVNNAGISVREGFGSLTMGVWNRIMKINLQAPVFISQQIANRWMSEKSQGVILNISSMAGEEPAFDAYGASKCALASMTKGMARTLAPYGIRVNAIAPGVVIGTNLREVQRSINPDGNVYCGWIPLRRYAVPEEIAELAVFAVSDRSSYMTGAVIRCDGAGAIR